MRKGGATPRVPVAGIVYSQITYWLVLLGMIITLVGTILCMASDGSPSNSYLVDLLWKGYDSQTIWEKYASLDEYRHGHWYLRLLPEADGIAMLGIAICCVAAVLGMWGASIAMLRSRERIQVSLNRLYFVFALVATVVLTLSALGIIALE